MKNYKSFIFLTLGMTLLTFITCKKSADRVFDGSGRLRGAVLFKNVADNALDTAAVASVRLYKKGDPSNYYVVTTTNGTFDMQALSDATYELEGSFTVKISGSQVSVTYTATQEFVISGGNFMDNYALTLLPSASTTPALTVMVKDSSGAAVPNAQVCLYADTLLLLKNENSTGGSVASGLTNSSGLAVFTGLQPGGYYAYAYITAGGDTISNADSATTTKITVNSKGVSNARVSVALHYPSLRIIVEDGNNAVIQGANICIYSDKNLLMKYEDQCTGSLRNGVTNEQGELVISHLQNLVYYISAYKVVGKDTLSNISTGQTTNVLINNNQNLKVLHIK
jgi:hypothetical protein